MSGGTSDVCFAQHGQASHFNDGTSDVCFAQQGRTSHFNGSNVRCCQGGTVNAVVLPNKGRLAIVTE